MLFHHRAHLLLGAAAFVSSTLLHSNSVLALTDTGTMQVTASVAQSCDVGTIPPLAFGAYEPGQPKQAQANFVVTCTSDGTVQVDFDDGVNSSIADQRNMKKQSGAAGDLIRYQLYTTNTLSTPWVAQVPKTVTLGQAQITVFGAIQHTISTNPPVGTYSDTVTVTVTF